MENLNIVNQLREQQDRKTLLRLYDQAIARYKSAEVEILLEPLNTDSDDAPENHTLELRNCIPDFEAYEFLDLSLLSLNELSKQVDEIHDYTSIMNKVFNYIYNRFSDRFKITFLSLHKHQAEVEEVESVSEDRSYADLEWDDEWDSDSDSDLEWEEGWETDSGHETSAELSEDSFSQLADLVLDSGVDE